MHSNPSLLLIKARQGGGGGGEGPWGGGAKLLCRAPQRHSMYISLCLGELTVSSAVASRACRNSYIVITPTSCCNALVRKLYVPSSIRRNVELFCAISNMQGAEIHPRKHVARIMATLLQHWHIC